MQKLIAAIGVTCLIATGALAEVNAPLPPAKPAGVAKAQTLLDNTPLLALGGIAVIVAVTLATNGSTSAATTTP